MMVDLRGWLVLPVAVALSACGGDGAAVAETPSVPASEIAAAATPAQSDAGIQPAEGGRILEVQMTMTGGGAFEPSEISARAGDVIRFINVDNVHNVNFPAAKNPGVANLPPPSRYMTQPGETYELLVEFAPGSYTFQCDPHVPMGMIGTLTVE